MIKSDRSAWLTSLREREWWLIFLGILACYALLILPTLHRLGIGWDEAVDLEIAQSYLSPRGMLLGTSRDPSQTRLPMFTAAMVFSLFGTTDLLFARFMSVIVGGLTLLGVFIYGKHSFSPATGLIAAGLLAVNPFFLAFARQAFTESDIYVACTLTWLLFALSRLPEKPTLGWAVPSGIFLGLTISSKATVLVLVPVVCISFVLSQILPWKPAAASRDFDLHPIPAHSVWLWTSGMLLAMLVGVMVSRQLNVSAFSNRLHLLNYGIVWLGWLITLTWAVRHRNFTASPIALAAFLAVFGLLTFVIIPPEHLANSSIIQALISRADQEITFSPGFMLELAGLHAFSIFLKSTPVLGLGLLAGYGFGLTQWRRRELILPLMVVSAYFLMLIILPLGQTFYTIPILPVLSLLAADQLLCLFPKWKKISLAFLGLGLLWWGVETKQCYPDYHLNGYQWLGARPFLGRSSIGYRSIVYVPSDGVQQSMEWLNAHAESGQKAQLYVEPLHIVKAMAADSVYDVIDGRETTLSSKPDYVVVHIGATIVQGEGRENPPGDVFQYPFDISVLQREYEQVFSVRRAFDLEMAGVWKRKQPA